VGAGRGATLRGDERQAAVFLNGEYEDEEYYRGVFARATRVIAADGGARFLITRGLRPDVLVGDFDSLEPALVAQAAADGVRIVRHPVRKDATDAELAVEEALAEGAGEVVLAGALGADLDHTFGNIAVLRRLAARRTRARIVSPALCIAVVLGRSAVRLNSPRGARVSLTALTARATVSLHGLDYGLERGVLRADGCLGLGNRITGAAVVTVHRGAVAVFVHHGGERFEGAEAG
jgi:thiamine pyrophosphokinase